MPRSWRPPSRKVSSRRGSTPPPGSKQGRHQQAGKEEQGDGGGPAPRSAPRVLSAITSPPTLNSPPTTTMNANSPPATGERSGPPVRLLEGRRGWRWPSRRSRPAGRRHHQQQQRQGTDGRDDHPGGCRASRQHHQQQHGNQGGHGQADPVARPPGPYQGDCGRHQHQGRHQLRGVKVPLIGLDQYQQQPEQPEQHGGHPHHARTRAPALASTAGRVDRSAMTSSHRLQAP